MKKDIELAKSVFDNEEEFMEFITTLHEEIATRKPFYYALIKGHKLITDEDASIYWNIDTLAWDMFPSSQHSYSDRYITALPIEEWNKLGIHDSNAHFIEVVYE